MRLPETNEVQTTLMLQDPVYQKHMKFKQRLCHKVSNNAHVTRSRLPQTHEIQRTLMSNGRVYQETWKSKQRLCYKIAFTKTNVRVQTTLR